MVGLDQIEKAAQESLSLLDSTLTWSCLFPKEQGVTGMNPSTLPASLTGRIWFFLICETT